MTSMISSEQVLKTDVLGRVKTPLVRREELLDEFERSGLSGTKFAALAGIKYQTFATWAQRRRRKRGSYPKPVRRKIDPVRWLEAIVDKSAPAGASLPLIIQLPGGARMELANVSQAVLAAHLLKALQKDEAAAC